MVLLTLVAVTVANFGLPPDLIIFPPYFVQNNKTCLSNIFFFIFTSEVNVFILKYVRENLLHDLYAIRILSIKTPCAMYFHYFIVLGRFCISSNLHGHFPTLFNAIEPVLTFCSP